MSQTKAQLLDGKSSSIQFSTGSASSPTVSFTGDTNTGIYSPGADQLAISTNSSERIRIGANGEIGLGGANYGTNGQVLTSAGSGAAPTWQTPTATTDKIEEGNTSAEVIDTGSDGRFVVTTEGSERLRVTSAGLVGIGASAPATLLEVRSATTNAARLRVTGTGTTAGNFRGYEFGNGSVFKGGLLQDESTDLISIFTPVGGQSFNITSAGAVGIGTTSPGVPLEVFGGNARVALGAGSPSTLRGYEFATATTVFGSIKAESTGGELRIESGFATFGGFQTFYTNGSERARIDSSGRLLVGTSTALGPSTTSTGITFYPGDYSVMSSAGNEPLTLNRNNDGNILSCRRSGTNVGSISVTTTATAFNTSSDYRLKENVTAVTDGITRLQQLKPSRFNFIADPDKTVDGFLAHEVQTVVPEAITGEKDAVDADGKPVYQGIDQSKLVPLLTAALQEAIGEIETLQGMIAVNNITIDEMQHQFTTVNARLAALETP